ncbi:MAG: endonuclease/exonuclease/phosphatase family protein [Candidatus Thiodiazotropha lotti]|nr:endonuclease/exonuclease/phosphatase family protein [Candidatus Thiodiazotropha lotti]
MAIKITSWNIEHAERLIGPNLSSSDLDRRSRVRETIHGIDPDILCMIEGPKGEQSIKDFAKDVLEDKWVPILLQQPGDSLGSRDKEYKISGTQWIWFIVRSSLINKCRLQAPSVWQSFTGYKQWKVHYWGQERADNHDHYRHPQVLVVEIGHGHELELIGVHLKSKINKKKILRDNDGNLVGAYVDEAMKARIKLATEAADIRKYIDAKFDQKPKPALIVLGDANDGPGRDLFENQYLFFDLVSNLEGDVMQAEKFFNHSLFDYPAHLRWSARYRDAVLRIPASQNPLLLDHIFMSQPLCHGTLPLVVNEGAGLVEHEVFERVNAGARSSELSSDHRPVSLMLTDITS